MPDWNVINALLAVAGSPLTLLILQLTQIVQTQVNAISSARTDARDHRAVIEALEKLDQRHVDEMGVFHSIADRLAMMAELIRRDFAPADPAPPFIAPPAPPSDPVVLEQVVEPDPLPRGGGMDAFPTLSSAPPARSSRELQVVRQQTGNLSSYLVNNPVSTSTILEATELERRAKELWKDTALAAAYQRLTAREQDLVRQTIPNWPLLQQALRDAIAQNAILVLPRVLGARPDDEYVFRQELQHTVDAYNERCEVVGALPMLERGPSRLRQAQRMLIASQSLAPGLAWTAESVAAVQRLLYMMPATCLQVDLRQPDGVAHLSAWYWATGDRRATTFSQWAHAVAPSPIPPRDQAFATAEMLIVLLADLLSLGASEGVSVVSDLLTQQNISERLQQGFHDWYRAMRAAFASNYGAVGVVGVPEVETEVVAGQPAILLATLRGCVAPAHFNASIKGYSDSAYLYLSMQDNDDVLAHVYYLVIEQRVDQRVAIRAYRESLGSTHMTMTDVDQRLNAYAAQCKWVFGQSPERFALVADAPLDTLIHHLGASLRARQGH